MIGFRSLYSCILPNGKKREQFISKSKVKLYFFRNITKINKSPMNKKP